MDPALHPRLWDRTKAPGAAAGSRCISGRARSLTKCRYVKSGAARPTCVSTRQLAAEAAACRAVMSGASRVLPWPPSQRLLDASLGQVPSTPRSRRSLPAGEAPGRRARLWGIGRLRQRAAPNPSEQEDPLVNIPQFTRTCA